MILFEEEGEENVKDSAYQAMEVQGVQLSPHSSIVGLAIRGSLKVLEMFGKSEGRDDGLWSSQFGIHQSKDDLCNIKYQGVMSRVDAATAENGDTKLFAFQIGRS